MRNKKFLMYISIIIFWFIIDISLAAYGVDEYITVDFINESKNITQGELAVLLINSIGLESELPTPPILNDYIKVLDKNGIRPLGGWVSNRMLTNGDFAVILACAMGVNMRLVSAQEVCEETRNYIQKMWEAQYRQDGYYKSLNELLQDTEFFPHGPPENPFGHKYANEDGDYVVDPIVILPDERELIPTVRYMFTLKRMGIPIEGPAGRILTLGLVRRILRSPIFRKAAENIYTHAFTTGGP